MMTVKKLRRRPASFLRLSGLSVEQFDEVLGPLKATYASFNCQRLARPHRQRQVGGGRQFQLALEERVLLVLVWMRLYVTNEVLGYLFGLDASSISRNRRGILPLVEAHVPVPCQLRCTGAGRKPQGPPPRRRKIGTVAELLKQYPEVRDLIVDTTEQPLQRPQHSRRQRQHYSGKKRRHTRKSLLGVSERGQIVCLSQSVPGRVHDYTLFHRARVDRRVPPAWGLRVDLGFKGIVRDYPHRQVSIPLRASKLHPLTRAQKRSNRGLARQRVAVEHALACVKKYRVIGALYRHPLTQYDAVLRTVCGLVNLRTQARLATV